MASVVASTIVSRANNVVKQPRIYTCSTCGRTFKRSEHCFRHERGHTNVKPFSCEFCGRKYARKDLVTRHVQSFHPNGHAERIQHSAARPSPSLDGSPQDTIILAEDESRSSTSAELARPSNMEFGTQELASVEQGNQFAMLSGGASAESLKVTDAPLNAPQNSQPSIMPLEPADEINEPGLREAQSSIGQPPVHSDQVTSLDNHHTQSQGVHRPAQFRTSNTRRSTLPNATSPTKSQGSRQWQSESLFNVDGYGLTTEGTESARGPHAENLFAHQHSGDIDFFALLSSSTPQMDLDFSALTSHLDYDHSMPQQSWGILDSPPPELPLQADRMSATRSETSQTPGADPLRVLPFIDDDIYANLQEEIRKRLPPEIAFNLPAVLQLQQFMKCYISCFHNHFPILHLPSLVTQPLYAPLTLAILAVGALYRLKRTTAKELWVCAQAMVEPDCRRKNIQVKIPMQALQAKLLLTFFAAFGGEAPDFVTATENIGFWAQEYRLHRTTLESTVVDVNSLTWAEWSSRETTKRLLCGIFILSSMLTVTYDTTPFLSITQDLNLEVPEPEQSWKATNAQQWEQVSYARRNIQLPTVRDALCHLAFNNPPQIPVSHDRSIWSGFATTVVMHAVNIHMWHIMQATQSYTGFPIENATLGHSMVIQVEQALTRCYTFLATHQMEKELTSESGDSPEIFNCQALLRSAYVRISTGAGSFDRMMLLSENEDEITGRIQTYVQAPQRRNSFLTKAVSKAYVGLLMPITVGFLLVKRTAALTWSVEHAIAAWDCALFVTKWIHGIETYQSTPGGPLDEGETENLNNFRTLLLDLDGDYEGSGSLAADVSHVWAEFLDDTWVWGITPRMGNLLRLLSKAYLEDRRVKLSLG